MKRESDYYVVEERCFRSDQKDNYVWSSRNASKTPKVIKQRLSLLAS